MTVEQWERRNRLTESPVPAWGVWAIWVPGIIFVFSFFPQLPSPHSNMEHARGTQKQTFAVCLDLFLFLFQGREWHRSDVQMCPRTVQGFHCNIFNMPIIRHCNKPQQTAPAAHNPFDCDMHFIGFVGMCATRSEKRSLYTDSLAFDSADFISHGDFFSKSLIYTMGEGRGADSHCGTIESCATGSQRPVGCRIFMSYLAVSL